MILVALMNDSSAGLQPESNKEWTQAKLGQMIILVELIALVKAVPRINKDVFVSCFPASMLSTILNSIVTALRGLGRCHNSIFQYTRSPFGRTIGSEGKQEAL
jgi:hypothetical protein